MTPTPIFPLNSTVRFSAQFNNVSGALADPTSVLFSTAGPDGVSYTYSATRDSVGKYHYDFITATPAGQWYYRFQGAGTLNVQSSDTVYNVQFPKF